MQIYQNQIWAAFNRHSNSSREPPTRRFSALPPRCEPCPCRQPSPSNLLPSISLFLSHRCLSTNVQRFEIALDVHNYSQLVIGIFCIFFHFTPPICCKSLFSAFLFTLLLWSIANLYFLHCVLLLKAHPDGSVRPSLTKTIGFPGDFLLFHGSARFSKLATRLC